MCVQDFIPEFRDVATRLHANYSSILKDANARANLCVALGITTNCSSNEISNCLVMTDIKTLTTVIAPSLNLSKELAAALIRFALYTKTEFAIRIKHVNTPSTHGNTLLHYAAAFNDLVCTYMLLFSGADRTIKNHHGLTAFDVLLVKCKRMCGLNCFCIHEHMRCLLISDRAPSAATPMPTPATPTPVFKKKRSKR
jgi:ankyrin repeat protein